MPRLESKPPPPIIPSFHKGTRDRFSFQLLLVHKMNLWDLSASYQIDEPGVCLTSRIQTRAQSDAMQRYCPDFLLEHSQLYHLKWVAICSYIADD